MANAVTAVHRVVRMSSRATASVRALAAGRDDPTAVTSYTDLGIEPRYPGLLESLAQDMDQPIVLAEHIGLAGVSACVGDHRGNVDASVIGVGQK